MQVVFNRNSGFKDEISNIGPEFGPIILETTPEPNIKNTLKK